MRTKLLALWTSLVLALLVVALPQAVSAAECTPTGFFRDGINMTAALINPGRVVGEVDATGCNIGVYFDADGQVKNAVVHGANYFGVLVNGDVNNVKVDVTRSSVYDIGETPFNGTQHGVGIYYRALGSGSATGKITDNRVYRYQKGGITANGPGARVSVKDNTVTGLGPVDFIAQNGIQLGFGASAKGEVEDNTVTGNAYTGPNWASSAGILIVGGPCYGPPDDYVDHVRVEGNKLVGNDVGVFLSNLDADCGPAAMRTDNVVKNNVIRNDAVTNTTGNDGSSPYQAGVSDQGNRDAIFNNRISGAGYRPCPPGVCTDIDVSNTIDVRVRVRRMR